MTIGLQWIVDKITFPSPPSSYSLTSHPELFFVQNQTKQESHPGVPCMLYAIKQGAPVLLVHAHSNGCDIGDMRQTLQSISESLRVHVMSFEFPGYGLHLGSANMQSIDEAAGAVLHYIVHDLKINLAQVVWYGRSIGSGPAIRAVHRISKEMKQQPGGVVLQCGFANFPEVAGHLFGRVAKGLVSTLWPNEAMLKELHCPVLLIHGRNDTMIPIQQSEKLWSAVSLKELSHFHTCDCGHNDFNFRRCTLRPIYDFLLGVISAPTFPATNFHADIDPTHRAYVKHIGPLRPKIPVYSFRRPDLEDWLRKVSGQKASATNVLAPLPKSSVDGSNVSMKVEGIADIATDVVPGNEDLKAFPTPQKVQDSPSDVKVKDPANVSTPPPTTPTSKKNAKRGKGKGNEPELLPIPDFSIMPPIEDVYKALLDPEGMVRTCAARVAAFLDRIQRQLDTMEGLESKPMEEVVEFVEAEFWACDPLLSLWEEVSLPLGEHVRFRFGPFSVDSRGQRSYHPGLTTGSAPSNEKPQLLRVPLWLFCPSQAHFRCLAEWSLLQSPRLERQFQTVSQGKKGSSCCCVLHSGLGRKSQRKKAQTVLQPTRGALATSLAAHVVNWVEKTEEIKIIFEKFVRLYKHPEETLQRQLLSSPRVTQNTGDDNLGVSPISASELEDCSPQTIPSSFVVKPSLAPPAQKVDISACAESRSIWHPATFSSLSKSFLFDGEGYKLNSFAEIAERLRTPASPRAVLAERQEGAALPNIADVNATAEYVAQPFQQVAISDRHADWTMAGMLLHYDRLQAGTTFPASHLGSEEHRESKTSDLRMTGLALNRAAKAFVNADFRRRREQQRPSLRQAPRPALKPSEADGDGEPQPPDDQQVSNLPTVSYTAVVEGL